VTRSELAFNMRKLLIVLMRSDDGVSDYVVRWLGDHSWGLNIVLLNKALRVAQECALSIIATMVSTSTAASHGMGNAASCCRM
jgi:hypothetical protein